MTEKVYNEIRDPEQIERAFKKCLRKGNFIFKLSPRKELKIFKDIQKITKAYTNSYLGIKNVDLNKIVGSVEKFTDFYYDFIPKTIRAQERWSNIYKEMLGDGKLPPVILYKIKDEYFVYDGNHRMSVAKFLNFKMIEAEVYEFFPGVVGKEERLYQEKFSFEKDTGLEGIETYEPGGYDRLRKKIEEFKYLAKIEELSTKEIASEWKRRVFNPVIKIYKANFPNENKKNGDVYLEFLRFKKNGFTEGLIEYIAHKKINESQNLEIDFKIDNILISEFRRLYNVDRTAFYKKEIIGKIKAIREYSRRTFKRENLIIGEIELYRKQKNIPGFILGMQGWFQDFYEEYEKQFSEKLKNLNLENKNNLNYFSEIIEDVVRFSRLYRKKYGRILTPLEIVYSYILDIFLPVTQILRERNVREEEEQDRYFALTQSYLYYKRYGGELGIIEYEKKYLKKEENQFSFNWLMKGKEEQGDIFRDIKKLLSYYSSTNIEGKKEIERFYDLINKYGGTENYQTVNLLKNRMINYYENTLEHGNYVEDILKEELLKFAKDPDIRIEYNALRILNLVRGVWEKYTFIDYYVHILQEKKEERKALWWR